jgi:NTE family protein
MFLFGLLTLIERAYGQQELNSAPQTAQQVSPRTTQLLEQIEAHPKSPPGVRVSGRPIVGLALEGGGALGVAHIGVLKWFEEHRIPVDRVGGTSMGALVGSLFASGRSPEYLSQLVSGNAFDGMFALKPSYGHLGFRRRQDREELPQGLELGLREGKISFGNALITDERINAFLMQEMVSYNTEDLEYDDLPTPFRCVATDLTTLRPVVFGAGSLAFAVRASISIPGVFPPVRSNGHILVDGAIVDNLPIDVVRKDLHADVVIAVHLGDSSFHEKDAGSLLGLFARAFEAGTSRNEELSRPQADIELLPNVDTFSPADYSRAAELIRAGYDAAESQRERLLPYALNEKDWQSYLDDRSSRRRAKPGRIDLVRVEGPSAAVASLKHGVTPQLQDRPFDEIRTDAIVSELRGGGAFSSFYETFRTSAISVPSLEARPAPDNGIAIHVLPNWDGPPYLLAGADVVAMNSNVTNTTFDLRLIDQNVGGYGTEWRSDARLGYLTRLATEYYLPIYSSGFYFQPHLQLVRQPVYLWQDQKRVSERFLQRAGGGLDLGFTRGRNLQVALVYQAGTVHWSLKDGTDDSPTPHLSGTVQTVSVHFTFNDQTSEIASPKGIRIDATVGELFHTAGSENSPLATLQARKTWTLGTTNLVSLSTEADSYFRHDVADPLRFTLGGPLRLFASSVYEYRGTDTVLGRAVYLRKVATLPTGLAQGVYITAGYEAGNIWSPENPAILRQDGFAGVLLSTPLGAMTFGGALGDAGRRKVYFTFGRLF